MKNCNQEIINALFRTKKMLSDEALHKIKSFVYSQNCETGGFKDRAGKSDIYYSVFAYTLALVYNIKLDTKKEQKFIETWNTEHNLDLVHAVCYIRCYLLLQIIKQKQSFGINLDSESFLAKLTIKKLIRSTRKNCQAQFELIDSYKSKDGAYNHNLKNADQATVYASFLVWTLFQDLNADEKSLNAISQPIVNFKCADHSFVNDTSSITGVSSATAAGLIMVLNQNFNSAGTVDYLMHNYTVRGGFKAAQDLPISDVLSTSTVLLALYISGENLHNLTEKSIDFLNLHWDESGGFFGSVADMTCDVEYTYYALLGIGILI